MMDQDGTPAAVYRVRNFTTKSGSVVNRGDSIKVGLRSDLCSKYFG